jgi:hypothetical protein
LNSSRLLGLRNSRRWLKRPGGRMIRDFGGY